MNCQATIAVGKGHNVSSALEDTQAPARHMPCERMSCCHPCRSTDLWLPVDFQMLPLPIQALRYPAAGPQTVLVDCIACEHSQYYPWNSICTAPAAYLHDWQLTSNRPIVLGLCINLVPSNPAVQLCKKVLDRQVLLIGQSKVQGSISFDYTVCASMWRSGHTDLRSHIMH